MNTIETEHLILRPFRESDAEAIFRNWTSDERVSRYCRWHPHRSIEETKELLKNWLEACESGFDYRWGITLKEKGDEVFGVIDVIEIFNKGKTAAMGYVLSHECWGRNIMTEALQAVKAHLFSCGFMEIVACHHVDNPASGRVMEKCGMKFTHYNMLQEKFGSDKQCRVKCYSVKNKKKYSIFEKILKKA